MPDDTFGRDVFNETAFEGATPAADDLLLDIEGYEGPLDLLLTLARTQKVDLRRISILELAEQYLAFVERAKALRIELAADYLVMAAWLAYLKSRLLLPPEELEGPSAEDLADHLAFQLERLEAVRKAAARLHARDQLRRDFFPRGEIEPMRETRVAKWKCSVLDLMQAFARVSTREDFRPLHFDRGAIFTVEEALERLRATIGATMDWTQLESFLPEDWRGEPDRRRSATASSFVAILEMAKRGELELKQTETFAPILIRKSSRETE
jgi:segregation and condensation protein A